MHKRTEITIETERFLIVSRRRDRTVLWCEACASDEPMMTVAEAARDFRFVESGLLHFARTPDGQLMICSNSLASERARKDAL